MIYVMSDIHGHAGRFESIMKQIKLQKEDTLYVLGDVVDRYPDGLRILRKLMKMENVRMLVGNHEYMMMQSIGKCKNAAEEKEKSNYKQLHLWYRNGGLVTHNYLKHIRTEYRTEIFSFISGLPANIDVEVNGIKYKLVHGSPIENFGRYYWDYQDYRDEIEYAVWERWSKEMPIPEGYILIFGHTPTVNFQDCEPWSIWKSKNAIGIDCGSGYEKGRLACLRLDDMKEFYSDC